MNTSNKEDKYKDFELSLLSSYLPDFKREYKFHPIRKWRIDFCWPDYFLAVEIEGGVWISGRHTRPTGFIKDKEKYNEVAKLGFCLLRFTPSEIKKGIALNEIKKWFDNNVYRRSLEDNA
jgi:very-short-patch-repair endonuclease